MLEPDEIHEQPAGEFANLAAANRSIHDFRAVPTTFWGFPATEHDLHAPRWKGTYRATSPGEVSELGGLGLHKAWREFFTT